MKKFEEFALNNPELVYGGDLEMTTCTGVAPDWVDTDNGIVIF